MTTRNYKKGMDPNFQTVKLCLIDTLIVDSEFNELLADRWFRPLRNTRAREVIAPMLCLPEHGGMVISVRDWLGGEGAEVDDGAGPIQDHGLQLGRLLVVHGGD